VLRRCFRVAKVIKKGFKKAFKMFLFPALIFYGSDIGDAPFKGGFSIGLCSRFVIKIAQTQSGIKIQVPRLEADPFF
jgi:hypothetical protein